MPKRAARHFLLIKKSGFSASGQALTGHASALRLLEAGYWPLWQNTRNKNAFEAQDIVLVYIAGDGPMSGFVVARATVTKVADWDKSRYPNYPLQLDAVPERVLHLSEVDILSSPISIRDRLNRLSFISNKTKKWGVALMGGARAVSPNDFVVLVGQAR